MADHTPGTEPEALQVPLSRIAAFVRQVTHDVRNNLNSMDLQAAYVSDLVSDPEARAEVKRIRTLIQTSARHLQALSANFQTSSLNLVTYTAAILVEDLRDRVGKNFPEEAQKITWEVKLAEEAVEVDVEAFFGAVMELFRNAFQFREEGQPLAVRAFNENGAFVLVLEETKGAPATAPEKWGMEPFVSSRRSGYGLGLFRARRVVKMHRGELTIFYDSARAVLVTRVWLPFATPT
jgi:signal transduction histidine kinase